MPAQKKPAPPIPEDWRLRVSCPSCGAAYGADCREVSGAPLYDDHFKQAGASRALNRKRDFVEAYGRPREPHESRVIRARQVEQAERA